MAVRVLAQSLKKHWSDYLFLLPNFAGVVLFILFPFFFSLYISFFKWDVFSSPEFIGLENYLTLLFEDELFWVTLKNTLLYVSLSIPLGLVVSLLVAVAMMQPIRGIGLFRTAMLVPVVSSMVAVGVIWRWIYAKEFGLLNYVLSLVGIDAIGWLTNGDIAIFSLAAMGVWKSFGFNAIILLAALQGVPKSLYEAASIDGASGWRQFWSISLPMIAPAILFVLIISVIGSFQVFDQVIVMTDGGPGTSTYVYTFYLFERAFRHFRMGYASALAYILFGLIFLITYLQFRLGQRYAEPTGDH